MPDDNRNWFITDRSEALAALWLTSREDVTVRSENKQDDGVDFLVALKDGEGISTKLFVVQVKGTLSSDKQDWTENVKPLFKSGSFYLPESSFR